MDLWDTLSQNKESSRTSIVHNIDDILGSAAITVGKWKIHKGNLNEFLSFFYNIWLILFS